MKLKSVFLVSALAAAGAANAALTFSNVQTTVTEDFNSFASNSFDAAKLAGTGATPAIGTQTAAGSFPTLFVSDGSSNAGGVYNYGVTSSSDRALGLLASGGFIGAFGVALVNNTTSPLTSVDLSFNTEQYRSSTSTQNVLAFSYAVNVAAATYLTNTTSSFSTNSAFNIVGAQPVATNGVITPTSSLVSGKLLVNVPVGSTLYLRWTDTNDVGNDAGLAIDNFSASVQAVPEPTSMVALGLGAVAMIRRRRSAK